MHESRHDFPSSIPKEHLRDARDVDVGHHCFKFSDAVEGQQLKLSTDVDRGIGGGPDSECEGSYTSMLQLETWHLYVTGGINEFRKGMFNNWTHLRKVTLGSGVSRRRHL